MLKIPYVFLSNSPELGLGFVPQNRHLIYSSHPEILAVLSPKPNFLAYPDSLKLNPHFMNYFPYSPL
jgi:hypothetical protein